MGSILDMDSTVHPCPCRGQRGQETGSVILTSVSKWRKSEGTGPGIRWYFASIAAGKQGQTCQCVSNAGLTELDLLSLCTTTLKKIHHVGKQNTPLLQTSLRNSAHPVHVTWQQPWLQFMFCLFSRLRGGFSFSIQQHYFFQIYSNNGLVTCLCLAKVHWCSSSISTKIWSSGAACTPSTWDFAILQTVGLWCYVIKIGSKTCYFSFVQCCFFFLVSLGVCDCFHGFSFDCFLGIFINLDFSSSQDDADWEILFCKLSKWEPSRHSGHSLCSVQRFLQIYAHHLQPASLHGQVRHCNFNLVLFIYLIVLNAHKSRNGVCVCVPVCFTPKHL